MSHPVTEAHVVQGERVRLLVGPIDGFDGSAADISSAVLRLDGLPHITLTAEDLPEGGGVALAGEWPVPADAPPHTRVQGQVWIADADPARPVAILDVVVSPQIPEAP